MSKLSIDHLHAHRPARLRKRLALLAAGLLAAAAVSTGAPAQAQQYPSQPIRIIVPFAAGGPVDLVARAVAEELQAKLGQPMIVESKPGANGIAGSTAVMKSAPDGYTMLITSSAYILNAALYKKLPYDPLKDFAPVSLIVTTQGPLLVVPADSEIKNVAEYVALAKKKNELSYANNGVGNVTHIVGELLAKTSGAPLTPVPYRGTAGFVTDVIAGHVPSGFIAPVGGIPHVKAGKMRALAIADAQRTPSLPDVPTFAEAGYPDVQLGSYIAAWFPAGTPRDRIDVIQKQIAAAVQTEKLKELFKKTDLTPRGSTPEQFTAFLQEDLDRVLAIQKKINLPPIE